MEKAEINTYREAEHDLLMFIRNGGFIDANNKTASEFYELVDTLTNRFEYAKNNSILSEKPDMERIEELALNINKNVIEKAYFSREQHKHTKIYKNIQKEWER